MIKEFMKQEFTNKGEWENERMRKREKREKNEKRKREK
jgi:hypothetical protein